MKKRLLASLLALCMVMSVMPFTAFADDENGDQQTVVSSTTAPENGEPDATDDTSVPAEGDEQDKTPADDETGETVEKTDETVEKIDGEPAEKTLEERVAALPTVDEFLDLDENTQDAIYAEVAELVELGAEGDKLDALVELFTPEVAPLEEPITKTVAKVGDTEYTTLAAAIEQANNKTVTLLANTEEDVTIPENTTVTLNLAGKTLTNKQGHTIYNKGTLTITGNGTVDNVTHAKAALYNEAGATATLNGGNFTRSMENDKNSEDNGGNSYYAVLNHGTMTINAGVSVTQNGHYSSLFENGWQDGKENTTKEPSKLTINGGTFTGGLNTIKNDDYGELTINGGSFSNTSQAAFLNWNVATVKGGDFKSNGVAILNGYGDDTMDKGQLEIVGGTFEGNAAVIQKMGGNNISFGQVEIKGGKFTATAQNGVIIDAKSESNANVVVTGGEFSSNDIESYVPAGSTAVKGEDGKFTIGVNTTTAVAQIGKVGYDTLAAAIDAAKDGDTVKLLKPTNVGALIRVSKGITLDLQDNLLTLKAGISFTNGSSKLMNGQIIDERSKNTTSGSYGTILAKGEKIKLETSNISIKAYQPSNSTTYNYAMHISEGAKVTLGKGTVIGELPKTSTNVESYGVVGVAVVGTSGTAAGPYSTTTDLIVESGVEITTTGFAISGNGTKHGTRITIEGGEITSKASTGIFHPHDGVMNITGGKISGITGIEVRAGEVNVSGSAEIIGTAKPTSSDANGSGTTTKGAGIAVVQHTTKLPTKVTISGGSVSGYTAVYETNVQNNTDSDIAKVEIKISGGEIKATDGGTAAVFSQNKSDFISGGNFSHSVEDKCLDDLNVELKKSTGDAPFSYYKDVDDAVKAAGSDDEAVIVDRNVAEAERVTVTFDANGGDCDVKSITVKEKTSITLPSASRSRYDFRGWYEKNGDKAGNAGKSYEVGTKDITLYAEWEKRTSSNTTSSGDYSISVKSVKNGKVTVSPKSADKGDTVTITVKPDKGYELDELIITDKDGDEISYKSKGNDKYTFTMPKSKVTVKATFVLEKDEDKTIVLTLGSTMATVFGNTVINDVAPVARNNRTMLPIRFIAEALGARVDWDQALQKVTIVRDTLVIEIFLNSDMAYVNGQPVQLDSPAFAQNNRTYLPLRFVAENLGAEVLWDAATQTVTILAD